MDCTPSIVFSVVTNSEARVARKITGASKPLEHQDGQRHPGEDRDGAQGFEDGEGEVAERDRPAHQQPERHPRPPVAMQKAKRIRRQLTQMCS